MLFLLSIERVGDNDPHLLEDTTIEPVLKTFEDFYQKKDYPNALLTLEKSMNELPLGLKHYNLGTVYAQMQQWPQARYHFLSAKKNGFERTEVTQNLEIAEAKLEVTKLEEPLSTSDYFIKYSTSATGGVFTTLALLILVVGLFVIKKSGKIKSAWILIPAVLVPLGVNLWIKSWPWAVVMKPAGLHDGPSAIFEARGELPPGLLVIAKPNGDWKQIIYPVRFSGWVKTDVLKEVE